MKKILGISLCALFAVSAANAEITSRGYVDQVVGANTTRINTLDTAIAGMNQNQTQGDYVTFVKQEGGQVTASGASFATNVATGGTSAPTSAAVVAYVEGQVNELEVGNLADRVAANESAIGENATKIATNDSRIAANEGKITTLEGKVGTNETNIATNTSDIATNATNIQTNKTNIQTNTGNITTLEGRVDGHDTSIAGLTQQVGINEGKINTLDEDIQAMDLTATKGDYVKVVSQVNGTVSATGASFAGDVATGNTNAPTSAAVVTYVADNAINTVENGTADGTIIVDGQAVSVGGLKALAYKDTVASGQIDDDTIMDADINSNARIKSSKIEFDTTQTGVFSSGIDGTKVAQIEANKTAIDAMVKNAVGYDDCKVSTYGCTLVVDVDGFKWEAVTREAQ